MKHNILVVDDSRLVTSSIKDLLEENSLYNCITAASLKETAEALLKYKGKFDVAILDLNLPDSLNGDIVDFVSKFNIPVIVLTGSDITLEELNNTKIVDYVIKDGTYSFQYAVNVALRIINNKNIKVLLVDDSKVYLKTIKDLLVKYNLEVFTALNGQEALDILQVHQDIKVVLTDYEMPIMDGLQLTRKLRKHYSKDEMSIIVSSSVNDKAASKFLKYGANDFLYKGFSHEEFYARLNSNLEILELFQKVKDKANKDYLTGMFNRRYLFDVGNENFERVKHRKDETLCVAILDIDHFKKINDSWGHDIGDIAIKEVAKILSNHLKSNSLVSRLGGEEFCVLLKGREISEIKKIFENIRSDFEKNIIVTDKCELKYTVSIGVCTKLQESLASMINKADDALYKAKENGRNKVVIDEG